MYLWVTTYNRIFKVYIAQNYKKYIKFLMSLKKVIYIYRSHTYITPS